MTSANGQTPVAAPSAAPAVPTGESNRTKSIATRLTVPSHAKLLVSRDEAAQLLSISVRGIDYLVATRRLPFRKIGGRVLIPVAELRKYANGDHPERIVA
jgi:excisionase family DNA binding protein